MTHSKRESWSVASNILASLIAVLAFPIYLYYFSTEVYGLWFTVSTLAGLCTFFECGVTLPIQQLFLKNELFRMRRLIIGATLLLLLGGGLVWYYSNGYLETHFHTHTDLKHALGLLALSEILAVLNTVCFALLNVSGRSLTCGLIRLSTEVTKIGLLLVLVADSGLLGASLAHVIASIMAFIVSILATTCLLNCIDWGAHHDDSRQTFVQDLALGLNQWVLNIFNKFSIRLILMALERIVFQANFSATGNAVTSQTLSLQSTGEAFILYRIAHFAYYAVKQGAPTLYKRVVSARSGAYVLKSGALFVSVLLVFYLLGGSLVNRVSPEALPESLVTLNEAQFSLAVICLSFVLMISVELVNYRLMIDNRLYYLKTHLLCNLAFSLMSAIIGQWTLADMRVSIALACLCSALYFVVYQLYWIRRRFQDSTNYRHTLLRAISRGCVASSPGALLVSIYGVATQSFWQICVLGVIALLVSMPGLWLLSKFVPKYFAD